MLLYGHRHLHGRALHKHSRRVNPVICMDSLNRPKARIDPLHTAYTACTCGPKAEQSLQATCCAARGRACSSSVERCWQRLVYLESKGRKVQLQAREHVLRRHQPRPVGDRHKCCAAQGCLLGWRQALGLHAKRPHILAQRGSHKDADCLAWRAGFCRATRIRMSTQCCRFFGMTMPTCLRKHQANSSYVAPGCGPAPHNRQPRGSLRWVASLPTNARRHLRPSVRSTSQLTQRSADAKVFQHSMGTHHGCNRVRVKSALLLPVNDRRLSRPCADVWRGSRTAAATGGRATAT